MGFAETTLGTLSGFAGLNATLAAIFALSSLGMVLLALVAMYFRDPAFLTFSSREAFNLMILKELKDQMPADLLASFVGSITPRESEGIPLTETRSTPWAEEERNEIESGLNLGGGSSDDYRS